MSSSSSQLIELIELSQESDLTQLSWIDLSQLNSILKLNLSWVEQSELNDRSTQISSCCCCLSFFNFCLSWVILQASLMYKISLILRILLNCFLHALRAFSATSIWLNWFCSNFILRVIALASFQNVQSFIVNSSDVDSSINSSNWFSSAA